MTKTELRHIAEGVIEELRELPDGTEISSGQLLAKEGYDPAGLEEGDLFGFHEALFRAAKANHITLDMSKHQDKVEGLPWNFDFIVRNKKARIKCPYCGSTDTARILYGMPAFSDELEQKLNSGKICLGGCCITAMKAEDGSLIHLDPVRHCNACGKEFAKPAYWQDNDRLVAYADMVRSIEFEVGGFLSGSTQITIKKNLKGAGVHIIQHPYSIETLPVDKQITPLRWMRLVNKLYNELYIHEWKKNYIDPCVLDGTQWRLVLKLEGRRVRTYNGSNDYPPYWKELKALFRPFAKL